MDERKIQLDLQAPALYKLMDIYSHEARSFEKFFLISTVAFAAIVLVGVAFGSFSLTMPYGTALLLSGGYAAYNIKVINDKDLDSVRWKPICEAILDAKYDEVLDKLEKLPKDSKPSVSSFSYLNNELFNIKIMTLNAYILKELFIKKNELIDNVRSRITERLNECTEIKDVTKQNYISFIESIKHFSQSNLTPVASKIHLALTILIYSIKNGIPSEDCRRPVANFSDTARWHFCDRSKTAGPVQLADFERKIFKDIEDCSTFADMQKVAKEITTEQHAAIFLKACPSAKN